MKPIDILYGKVSVPEVIAIALERIAELEKKASTCITIAEAIISRSRVSEVNHLLTLILKFLQTKERI